MTGVPSSVRVEVSSAPRAQEPDRAGLEPGGRSRRERLDLEAQRLRGPVLAPAGEEEPGGDVRLDRADLPRPDFTGNSASRRSRYARYGTPSTVRVSLVSSLGVSTSSVQNPSSLGIVTASTRLRSTRA